MFITVFAPNKSHEAELALELNPTVNTYADKRLSKDTLGYPIKVKGLYLHEVRDFDDYAILFRKDVRDLLKMIQDINPFKEYPEDLHAKWEPSLSLSEVQRIAEAEKIQREYMCKICIQRKRFQRITNKNKRNEKKEPHILIVPHDNEEENKMVKEE